MSLAVMAGSVGRGTFVPPVLVVDRTPSAPRPARALDGAAVAQLRSMMASVVASGTGTALRGHPRRPGARQDRHGRARQRPRRARRARGSPATSGDVAFAVLVEEGKSGGTVAAPIAKEFLTEPVPRD